MNDIRMPAKFRMVSESEHLVSTLYIQNPYEPRFRIFCFEVHCKACTAYSLQKMDSFEFMTFFSDFAYDVVLPIIDHFILVVKQAKTVSEAFATLASFEKIFVLSFPPKPPKAAELEYMFNLASSLCAILVDGVKLNSIQMLEVLHRYALLQYTTAVGDTTSFSSLFDHTNHYCRHECFHINSQNLSIHDLVHTHPSRSIVYMIEESRLNSVTRTLRHSHAPSLARSVTRTLRHSHAPSLARSVTRTLRHSHAPSLARAAPPVRQALRVTPPRARVQLRRAHAVLRGGTAIACLHIFLNM